jgi:hypothetical protein
VVTIPGLRLCTATFLMPACNVCVNICVGMSTMQACKSGVNLSTDGNPS